MLRLARLVLLGCAALVAITAHAVTTTTGLYAHGPLTLYSPPPYVAFAGDVVTLQGYVEYTLQPGQILPDPGGSRRWKPAGAALRAAFSMAATCRLPVATSRRRHRRQDCRSRTVWSRS